MEYIRVETSGDRTNVKRLPFTYGPIQIEYEDMSATDNSSSLLSFEFDDDKDLGINSEVSESDSERNNELSYRDIRVLKLEIKRTGDLQKTVVSNIDKVFKTIRSEQLEMKKLRDIQAEDDSITKRLTLSVDKLSERFEKVFRDVISVKDAQEGMEKKLEVFDCKALGTSPSPKSMLSNLVTGTCFVLLPLLCFMMGGGAMKHLVVGRMDSYEVFHS